MRFVATFISGGATVGVLEFKGDWEDFISRYRPDTVLQKKVELEIIFGFPVSVIVEPKEERKTAARRRVSSSFSS